MKTKIATLIMAALALAACQKAKTEYWHEPTEPETEQTNKAKIESIDNTESGMFFLPDELANNALKITRIETMSQLSFEVKQKVFYLSLTDYQGVDFSFLRDFNNLKMLILPNHHALYKNSLESIALSLSQPKDVDNYIVVLYDPFLCEENLQDGKQITENRIIFVNIFSECETRRLNLFNAKLINFQTLQTARIFNNLPVYDYEKSKLIADLKCDRL